VTLIDSSYKGSIQVMLQELYPRVAFQGRYAFFGQSPHDPHPSTKQGYVVHRSEDRLTGAFPADVALTFAHAQAIGALEDTLNGPMSSPRRIDEIGPAQAPLRDADDPLAGINPVKVAAPFADPRVREAAQRVNRIAVADYAEHVARLAARGDDVEALLAAGAARYTLAVRRWITGDHPDPVFARIADAFVYRADRKLIGILASRLRAAEVSSRQVRRIWQRFDRLATPAEKNAFVAGLDLPSRPSRAPRGRDGRQ
jgi:hypothetical protein